MKRIDKFCLEWHLHTKAHIFPWPKEGTFDTNIIEHTKTCIKTKYAGQKKDNRESMLELWAIFEEAKTDSPTMPIASKASAPPPPNAGMDVLIPAPPALGY